MTQEGIAGTQQHAEPETGTDEELGGWSVSAGVLSALTIMFACLGIWALLTDDIGIVASGLWFFGLPVALVFAVLEVVSLFGARRADRRRGRRTSRVLEGAVITSCALLAVLLGMGLTHFW